MPIVAVAIAAVADFAAAGSFAAVLAGTASLTATMAVVGAVGATVAAIGAVTGDKTLSTIGMVIGGIGAIGGLASAAGVFDSGDAATSAADSAVGDQAASQVQAGLMTAPVTDDAGNTFDVLAGSDGTNPISALAGTQGTLTDAINTAAPLSSASGAVPEASDLVGKDFASGSNFGSQAQDAAARSMTPSGSSVDSNTSIVPGKNAPMPNVAVTPEDPGVAAQLSGTGYNATPPSTLSNIFGVFGKNDNAGLLAMGGVQTLGSLISGATNPMTPAQITALNAQAAQNQAAANLQTQQNINMGQPVPTATRTQLPNITGAPAGIINAPGTTSTITGGTG